MSSMSLLTGIHRHGPDLSDVLWGFAVFGLLVLGLIVFAVIRPFFGGRRR